MSKTSRKKFGSKYYEDLRNILNAFEIVKDLDKEHKSELDTIKIEQANKVLLDFYDDKSIYYLIQISAQDISGFRKIHSYLTKKMEERLNNPVIIILKRNRINGKDYKTFTSKKVPRDKTLTAVFDNYYLEDLLYPATIIGKRVSYSVGNKRIFKVYVDPLDKEIIQHKIPVIIDAYRALTNRLLTIEF